MTQHLLFRGVADGKFCSQNCPRLESTMEGVPEHVHKAYPNVRNYACQFFGSLSEPQPGGGFVIRRPKRATGCLETALPGDGQ